MEALRSSVPEASTSFLPHVTLLSGLTSEDGWTQEKILNTTLEAIRDWRLERDELLDCIKCELLDVTTRGMYFQVRLRSHLLVSVSISDQFHFSLLPNSASF